MFASFLHPVSESESPSLFFGMMEYPTQFNQGILSGRIVTYWKETLMIAGIVTAVIGIALAIFSGSGFLTLCFLFSAATCTAGLHYLLYDESLQRLRETATELQEELDQLTTTNQELTAASHQLQQANQALTTTAQDLQATRDHLEQTNHDLTQQVTDLTLKVTQLKESAELICQGLIRFQEENTHLSDHNVHLSSSLEALHKEIVSSRTLCDQIDHYLTAQKRDVSQQLQELRQLIITLQTDPEMKEQANQFIELRKQIEAANAQLRFIQNQYAAKLSKLHDQYVNTRHQLDQEVQELRAEKEAIRAEREAITEQRKQLQEFITNSQCAPQSQYSRTSPVLGKGKHVKVN